MATDSSKKTKKMSGGKKALIIITCIFGALLLIVGIYAAYLFGSYHRIPDNVEVDPINNNTSSGVVQTGTEYKSVSYNTGFAAYLHDFDFFMDGGKQSWAKSMNSVIETVQKMIKQLNSYNADFVSLQEVDFDSTRTYYVNEDMMYRTGLPQYNTVSAQFWDSPFLFAPPTQPHGFCRTNQMTLSKFAAKSSLRRSFVVEDSVKKIADMDRGYTATRYPTSNGRELVYYTTHMSAYTSDPQVALDQVNMIAQDMAQEYAKGNYCICGADFNKDVTLGQSIFDSGVSAGESSFPVRLLEGTGIKLISPVDLNNPQPTCRDAGTNYENCTRFMAIDGFLVSDNIDVITKRVINEDFVTSDHNPVEMTFKLR